MIEALQRTTLFALYQIALVLGIVLMPIAVLAQRGGVSIPIHRLVESIGDEYDRLRSV